MKVSLLASVALCSLLLASRDARADEAPAPLDTRTVGVWDHFEFSMGFLAERRSYQRTNFSLDGAETVPGAANLTAPFQRAPYRGVDMYGLRYELRLVAAYVRMTVGTDIPFAAYRTSDATFVGDVNGTPRTISARSLSVNDVHFGIGAEYPFGPVAPFVDVLGAVRWVNTELAIDGTTQQYSARQFGLGVRAGVRLHVRRWLFVSAAGEAGFTGDLRWGGDLAVGFAFGKF